MNNNGYNYDQEMILRQKIEKREKFDTILAYILLVVLVGCIGLVIGLKFFRDNEELRPPVDEYNPTYISLGEIASSLNNSVLANRYMNDGASFVTTVNGNALLVSYVNDDVNLNVNIPMVGSELMINVPADNSEIVTEVYKEIANIICMYYGNEEKYCRYTLDNMSDNGTDGITFDKNGDNSIIYVTTTKSYSIMKEIVYNEVTLFDFNQTNHVIEMNEVKVHDIVCSTTDSSVLLTAIVDRLSADTSYVAVIVKLYDEEGNVLGENKYEFTEDRPLVVTGTFDVEFMFNDVLKLENIDKYSIEIVK